MHAIGSSTRIALFDALGEPEKALAEFERGRDLFESWVEGHGQYLVTLLSRPEGVARVGALAVEWGLAPPEFASDLETRPERALEYLGDMGCANAIACMLGAAIASKLGDSDAAQRLLRGSIDRQTGHFHYVWRPAFRDIRQTDGFKQYMEEIGLVDYWKEHGWPTFCQPVGDDDFGCR